jgi:hypothetical protein
MEDAEQKMREERQNLEDDINMLQDDLNQVMGEKENEKINYEQEITLMR